MRRLDGITDLKDFSLSKVQELDGQGSLVCRNPWDLKESYMTEWNELNWTEHGWHSVNICSVQFSSVAQSCPTLCDPMDCSTPGFPVHHQLPEFTRTHVHWVGDAIHPTISSSAVSSSFCLQPFPASGSFPMSHFFTWGGQSIGVSASTSVLPMNIQDWLPLGLTGLSSLQSKGLSRVFSNTTVGKLQFFDTQPSLWSSSHICTWLLEKNHNFD